VRTEIDVARDIREHLTLHDADPHECQLVLRRAGMLAVETLGRDIAERCIAEKFEALVVWRTMATMRQREREQLGVSEAVTELAFEPVDAHSAFLNDGWTRRRRVRRRRILGAALGWST